LRLMLLERRGNGGEVTDVAAKRHEVRRRSQTRTGGYGFILTGQREPDYSCAK
jgi:hypothetical protein